jgi:hypothetical protein
MSSNMDKLAQKYLDVINAQFQKNAIDDGFTIGQIISLDPLTIEVEGLPLYESNLYINKYLLAWDETVNIETSVVDDHSHSISIIHHPSKLIVGYSVALYGVEWDTDGKTYQKYCLLDVLI